MKELIEGALELPGDKYRREIDQLKKKIAEDQIEKEKEIQKREAEIQKREAEIQKLKKQLEESRKNNNLK
ncbi:MAG: hypothetical protein PHG16_04800 [Lachnospiraceae bacterium]|nr:hypothetical protein [Lachnospiraceae bacterium]